MFAFFYVRIINYVISNGGADGGAIRAASGVDGGAI